MFPINTENYIGDVVKSVWEKVLIGFYVFILFFTAIIIVEDACALSACVHVFIYMCNVLKFICTLSSCAQPKQVNEGGEMELLLEPCSIPDSFLGAFLFCNVVWRKGNKVCCSSHLTSLCFKEDSAKRKHVDSRFQQGKLRFDAFLAGCPFVYANVMHFLVVTLQRRRTRKVKMVWKRRSRNMKYCADFFINIFWMWRR